VLSLLPFRRYFTLIFFLTEKCLLFWGCLGILSIFCLLFDCGQSMFLKGSTLGFLAFGLINFGVVRKLRHAKKRLFRAPLPPLSQIFQRKKNFVFGLSQILLPPPSPKAWRNLRTIPFLNLNFIRDWFRKLKKNILLSFPCLKEGGGHKWHLKKKIIF